MTVKNLTPSKPPVNFYWEFAEVASGAKGGLLLSQLYELTLKNQDSDGWFPVGSWDWYDTIFITPNEAKTIRRILKELGVLEERRVGFPSQMFFRVNMENLRGLVNHRAFARLPHDL